MFKKREQSIYSPENGGGSIIKRDTSETEIAYLQFTISISKNVLGLEISMKDISSVNILKTTKKLVQEKLIMLRCKIIISFNDLMKIRFHQLKNNINIPEFTA